MDEWKYRLEQFRLESFPKNFTPSPEKLAKYGFFFSGFEDYIICCFCRGLYGNFKPNDDILVIHTTYFPDCPIVKDNLYNRVHNSYTPDKIYTTLSCTNNNFNLYSTRLETFSEHDKDRIILASNGFYKTIIKDTYVAICFYCAFQFPLVLVLEMVKYHKQVMTHCGFSQMFKDDDYSEDKKHEGKSCLICLNNLVSVMLYPCQHVYSCPPCAFSVEDCSICRIKIKARTPVFLS